MQFQMQAFNPAALSGMHQNLAAASAFADVALREFNRIKHEDGQLQVVVSGQVVRRATELHLVFASFQHGDFNKARRQWYEGSWNPNQEAGKKPDCASFDNSVPDAGVARPQAASCAECPNSKKGDDGYTGCSYRKSFIVYLVNTDAAGNSVVDTSTPYVFDASSKSMYTEIEATTGSGGTHRVIPFLRTKYSVSTIEGVVFGLGFYQGAKAPVIRPIGALPTPIVAGVLEAARQPSVVELLAPIKASAAPALPAPTQAAAQGLQYTPPAQATTTMFQHLAAAQTPPVQAPVQAPVVAAPEPVAAAPVMAQPTPEQIAAWMASQQAAKDALQAAAPAPAPAAAPAAGPVAALAPTDRRAKALGAFGAVVGTM